MEQLLRRHREFLESIELGLLNEEKLATGTVNISDFPSLQKLQVSARSLDAGPEAAAKKLLAPQLTTLAVSYHGKTYDEEQLQDFGSIQAV